MVHLWPFECAVAPGVGGGGQWEGAGYFYWAKKVHLCLTLLDPHYCSHRAEMERQSRADPSLTAKVLSATSPQEVMSLISTLFYNMTKAANVQDRGFILGKPFHDFFYSGILFLLYISSHLWLSTSDKSGEVKDLNCLLSYVQASLQNQFFAHYNKCQKWRLDN